MVETSVSFGAIHLLNKYICLNNLINGWLHGHKFLLFFLCVATDMVISNGYKTNIQVRFWEDNNHTQTHVKFFKTCNYYVEITYLVIEKVSQRAGGKRHILLIFLFVQGKNSVLAG